MFNIKLALKLGLLCALCALSYPSVAKKDGNQPGVPNFVIQDSLSRIVGPVINLSTSDSQPPIAEGLVVINGYSFSIPFTTGLPGVSALSDAVFFEDANCNGVPLAQSGVPVSHESLPPQGLASLRTFLPGALQPYLLVQSNQGPITYNSRPLMVMIPSGGSVDPIIALRSYLAGGTCENFDPGDEPIGFDMVPMIEIFPDFLGLYPPPYSMISP